MEIAELKVLPREAAGKSVARKLRAQGKVPGVLYGEKIDSTALVVDTRELMHLVHGEAGYNVIVSLSIEGSGAKHTAIIKEIQRDPMRNGYLHVDFQEIALDEEITGRIPIAIVGESPGVKEGGVLQHGVWEIEVRALPRSLPEHFEIDIGGLSIGEAVRVSDLTAPEGVVVTSPPDEVVVSVVAPTVYREEEVVEAVEEVEEPEVAGEAGEGKPKEKEEAPPGEES